MHSKMKFCPCVREGNFYRRKLRCMMFTCQERKLSLEKIALYDVDDFVYAKRNAGGFKGGNEIDAGDETMAE